MTADKRGEIVDFNHYFNSASVPGALFLGAIVLMLGDWGYAAVNGTDVIPNFNQFGVQEGLVTVAATASTIAVGINIAHLFHFPKNVGANVIQPPTVPPPPIRRIGTR